MARIRVYRDETDGELFPEMCIRCGAAADADVDLDVNFAWMPGWVHLFIFMGLLPWLIAALILRKTMRVTLPVCQRHRSHWRNRRLYIGLGFLFWVVFAIALAIEWRDLPEEAASATPGFLVFGGLLWLIVGLFYVNGAIKPAKITDRWNELVGVNKDFAREWKESEPEPEPSKRRSRRRDYDDDE